MAAGARGIAAGTEPVSWEPLPASAQFTVKVAPHLPLLSTGLLGVGREEDFPNLLIF